MEPARYNLLILSPSSLRADFLSCYGHPRVNTWYLDQLAFNSVRFDRAYTVTPVRNPAWISLATSTYPSEHGYRHEHARLRAPIPHLSGILREHGFACGLFGRSPGLPEDAIPELFEAYDVAETGDWVGLPQADIPHATFSLNEDHPFNRAQATTDALLKFIHAAGDQRFMAWAHYDEPRPPYACPPPYDFLFEPGEQDLPPGFPPHVDDANEPRRNEVWRQHARAAEIDADHVRLLIARYMGRIRQLDDQVGRILAGLRESGQHRHTIVLFVGDHGDFTGYRGMTWFNPTFYETLTRIPAILHHPSGGWRGKVFKGLVESVDFAPTLLDMLHVPTPPTMVGQSLLPQITSDQINGRESIYVEAGYGAPTEQYSLPQTNYARPIGVTPFGPGAMVRREAWKLALYADDNAELYNLHEDPWELHNLYDDFQYIDVRERMTAELARRSLAARIRYTGVDWPATEHPVDVRALPLAETHPAKETPPLRRWTQERIEATPRKASSRKKPPKFTKPPFKPKPGVRVMNHLLFVCTGNYYRSRFAEAYFNYYADILNLRWVSFSRGFRPEDNPDDISPITLDALAERDIPLEFVSARKVALGDEDLEKANRVICLDQEEHQPLMAQRFPNWADRVEYWDVKDVGDMALEEALSRIERNCTDLIKELDKLDRSQ